MAITRQPTSSNRNSFHVSRPASAPTVGGPSCAYKAGIGDLEIGYSARNAAEWDHLMEALEAFELVETTAAHLHRARRVQRLLAARRQKAARSRTY